MRKTIINTVKLVKGDHTVIVNDPSKQKDHWLNSGYVLFGQEKLIENNNDQESISKVTDAQDQDTTAEEVQEVVEKPKRKRRTKAEIEADKQSQ